MQEEHGRQAENMESPTGPLTQAILARRTGLLARLGSMPASIPRGPIMKAAFWPPSTQV